MVVQVTKLMSKVAAGPPKKRKDDLTAIAGAQLDWEHRKIREKGGSRETYWYVDHYGFTKRGGDFQFLNMICSIILHT